MHASRGFEILIRVAFCAVAAVFAVRVGVALRQWRRRDPKVSQRPTEGWERQPKWLASGIVILFLIAGFIWLGTTTVKDAYHWRVARRSALYQKPMLLDLHIPNVNPDQTYTVIAKFGVRGRTYVSKSPLRIRFGQQKPGYRVVLFYDDNHPDRNSWTKFQIPAPWKLNRILIRAIGCMIFAILLLEWLKTCWIRRPLVAQRK